jgi:hypothetical protein
MIENKTWTDDLRYHDLLLSEIESASRFVERATQESSSMRDLDQTESESVTGGSGKGGKPHQLGRVTSTISRPPPLPG